LAILKKSNPATVSKIETLLQELAEHPTTGTGKPERLKHNFSGCWSRRITQKHRLIYSIDDEVVTVFVLAVDGHNYFTADRAICR
jgi:toxin YoeB